jgi:hypothetical protein
MKLQKKYFEEKTFPFRKIEKIPLKYSLTPIDSKKRKNSHFIKISQKCDQESLSNDSAFRHFATRPASYSS